MRFFIKALLTALAIFLLGIFHLSVAYILPFPFDKLNVIFGTIVVLILLRPSGALVWVSFLTHMIVELYTITPFGVTLFSATVSTLITYWLFETVFTNRSWYAAIGLIVFSLCTYRFLYVLILLFVGLFSGAPRVSLMELLPVYGWEILFTTAFVGVGYAALQPFVKKFDRKAIHLDQ